MVDRILCVPKDHRLAPPLGPSESNVRLLVSIALAAS